MPVPNQIESIVRDELHALLASLQTQLTDPEEFNKLRQMAEDAAMLPIRLARHEDVRSLLAALRAEAENRALTHRIEVRQAIVQAWTRAVQRILVVAIAAI